MLEQISYPQLLEWVAFCDLSPFNQVEERADLRAGLVATTVFRSQGVKKRGGGEFQPWDFFDTLKEPEKLKQSVGQMTDMLKMFAKLNKIPVNKGNGKESSG